MQLDRKDVKEYFQKGGTVSQWWEPEEGGGLFRDIYVQQRQIVGQIFNPSDKIVLDAGTGKGRFAIDFAKQGARKVHATDISQEMLTIAEERAAQLGVDSNMMFEKMDIENLEFPDNIFDVACCMETFVHLPNPQRAMDELARVVKPGGLVMGSATLPIRNWYVNITKISNFNQLFEWVFTPIYQSGMYQKGLRRILGRPALVGRPLPPDYFSSLFVNSRLSITKKVYLGHARAPHFLLIAARK